LDRSSLISSQPERQFFPLVSVIILNYNGKEFLEPCLKSVLNSDYPNFEVVLVDNGSTDGSLHFVKDKFGKDPHLRVIANSENLGFVMGNTIGIQHSKGDLLVILNNDTEATPNWLKELIRTTLSNPRNGICVCNIFTPNLPEGLLGHMDKYGRAVLVKLSDVLEKNGEIIAAGPAFLIRREVFEKIGGYDLRYFAYFDDMDLSWRAKLLGYRTTVAENSKVSHKLAGTTSRLGLSMRRYLTYRNTLRTLVKNYSFSTLVKTLPISLTLILLESMALTYTFKNISLLLPPIKAILWNVKNFEDTWALHKEVQKSRVIDDATIQQIMAPFRPLRRMP